MSPLSPRARSNLRLGAYLTDPPEDPQALAQAHVAAGYTSAYCPPCDLADAPRLRALRAAFQAVDVTFAEAGAWCNLLASDPVQRARNHDYACRQLTLADELGAACAVDYLGSVAAGSEYGPDPGNLTPETFAAAVEVVRSIIDRVKPKRATFALEMMQWIIPDSIACYRQLIDAVDRRAFGVHVDPVNLILTPRQYYDTASLLRQLFRELGPHIVSCHAKDIKLRNELALHFDEVPPGEGNLDYRTYLQLLRDLPREVPLMLEHLPSHAHYQRAAEYVRSQDTH